MSRYQNTRSYIATLGVLSINALAFSISQTLVAPALPEIRAEVGASAEGVSFVITSFLVAGAVATGIVGRLGDMFGKRRMLVFAMSCFCVGSLIAGIADSLPVLIGGRVIQGIAGAVFPLAFSIVRDEFPPRRVATGIGIVSSVFGVGGGIGLVLSGPVVEHLGIHWIFLIGIPITLAGIAGAFLFVPESPVRVRSRIDWGGALLLSAGLAALLIAISRANAWGWVSLWTIGVATLGLALLWVCFLFERGRNDALIDIDAMSDRTVLASDAAALLIGFGMFGAFILTPQFVQLPPSTGIGLGASVSEAGLFLAPSPGVILVSGTLAGYLGTRIGSRRTLLAGAMIAACGFVATATFLQVSLAIYVASAVQGLGIGFCLASMPNLVVGAVDQSLTGIATGINTIMRLIGGALGAQAVTTIATAADHGELSHRAATSLAFGLLAIAALVAALVAKYIPAEADRRREPHLAVAREAA